MNRTTKEIAEEMYKFLEENLADNSPENIARAAQIWMKLGLEAMKVYMGGEINETDHL